MEYVTIYLVPGYVGNTVYTTRKKAHTSWITRTHMNKTPGDNIIRVKVVFTDVCSFPVLYGTRVYIYDV